MPINPDQPVAAPAPAPAMSAGAALRRAREAAGLHIGALAVALKVPVKKLEALESDDLGQLPDAVFARALAASVCRTLKIDPEPILRLLPQLQAPPLQVGSQAGSATFATHRGGFGMRSFLGLPRSVRYTTAGLLIAALAVLALPSFQGAGDPGAHGQVAKTVAPTPEPRDGAAAIQPVQPAAALVDAAASAPVASPASAAVAAPATAASATPVVAAGDAKTALDGAANAVFAARSACWVQVVDAAGEVLLRRTMGGGETANVTGKFPLSVVIGRADAIDVVVRGKAFDLAAVAKDNVARFQIP